jgi:hypothetical protein
MVILSIYGACLGSEKAAIFFNSIPAIVFWALLAFVLISGMFAGLRRNPFLFLMHAGCLLVLAGGGWSSRAALNIKRDVFRRPIFSKALLKIYPQQAGNVVYSTDDNEFYRLPFFIRLDDFSISYYDSSQCVSDYTSKTTIIDCQKPVRQKNIEVNKPLYFGGYHIYQHSWGEDEQGRYSVFQIVSAEGLPLVFLGFFFIALGVAACFWKELFKRASGTGQEAGNGD